MVGARSLNRIQIHAHGLRGYVLFNMLYTVVVVVE